MPNYPPCPSAWINPVVRECWNLMFLWLTYLREATFTPKWVGLIQPRPFWWKSTACNPERFNSPRFLSTTRAFYFRLPEDCSLQAGEMVHSSFLRICFRKAKTLSCSPYSDPPGMKVNQSFFKRPALRFYYLHPRPPRLPMTHHNLIQSHQQSPRCRPYSVLHYQLHSHLPPTRPFPQDHSTVIRHPLSSMHLLPTHYILERSTPPTSVALDRNAVMEEI